METASLPAPVRLLRFGAWWAAGALRVGVTSFHVWGSWGGKSCLCDPLQVSTQLTEAPCAMAGRDWASWIAVACPPWRQAWGCGLGNFPPLPRA